MVGPRPYWGNPQRLTRTGVIHEAAELGSVLKLEDHVRRGLDNGYPERVTLQIRDSVMGAMPIHFAAERGHMHILQYLVDRQVDLDAGDSHKVTALHLAAICNQTACIKYLLSNGAKRNLVDADGDTPLHWAATKGHVEAMKILIDYQNLDQANNAGWTPLHRACFNGKIPACGVLLKRGASLLNVNVDGNTPLHLACASNQMTTVEYLLGWGPKLDLANHKGQVAADLVGTTYASIILDIFAEHQAAMKRPGRSRQVTRKALARTSVAPERSPSRGDGRRLSDPSQSNSPRSPSPDISRAFSLQSYPSFGHKDEQGFPLIQEGEGIQITPPVIEDHEENLLSTNRQSIRQGSSVMDGSTGILMVSELQDGKDGEGVQDLNAHDMSPWDSEEDRDTKDDGSYTLQGQNTQQVKQELRPTRSLGSGRRRTSWNKKFLEKYSLQKHHLFGP